MGIAALFAGLRAAALAYLARNGLSIFLKAAPTLAVLLAAGMIYLILAFVETSAWVRYPLAFAVVLLGLACLALGFELRGELPVATPEPAKS